MGGYEVRELAVARHFGPWCRVGHATTVGVGLVLLVIGVILVAAILLGLEGLRGGKRGHEVLRFGHGLFQEKRVP